jgi:hypothetical protein
MCYTAQHQHKMTPHTENHLMQLDRASLQAYNKHM